MDIRNRRAIRTAAGDILRARQDNPNLIALWYAGVLSVMALLATFLSALLSDRIAETGGLSNMGLRSILSTAETLLPMVQFVVNACLSLGYHYAILCIVRGADASPRSLLDGFRNFGPILRATVFQSLLYFSQAVLSLYAACSIFMMLPVSAPFYEAMEPLLNSASVINGQLPADNAILATATETLLPMFWIWLGLFLMLYLPAYYGLRFTNFCIADNPRRGALAAMAKSRRMLRGNRIALLKLDISMWWFYALQFLVSVILYGDYLLPLVGIRLPWSETFSYYFFFMLSIIVQLVGYYFLMNRVYTAYALVYEGLQTPPPSDSAPIIPDT